MEQQAEHLLQLNHLTTCFKTDRGTLPAVDDVSWYVDKGEIVAMVGESGSGKTVSCLSIINLASQWKNVQISGSIQLDGRELVGCTPSEMKHLRGKEIGAVQKALAEHILAHPEDNRREKLLALIPVGQAK